MVRKRNQKGFTLVELMIVGVAFGVVAALAIPQLDSVIPKLKLKTMGREIVSDLRLARSNAISQRSQYGVYFDWYENQFILFKDQVNLSSFTYDEGDSAITSTSLGQDMMIYNCTFNNLAVVFTPGGEASSSGFIELMNMQGYESMEDTELINIDVLASTGRVKMTKRSYGDYR